MHMKSTWLENELDTKLFGQHLVKHIVTTSLRSHLMKDVQQKALVMSFHGWPGTGKSYVSKMIVRNLFKNQFKSQFFHQYIGSKDFPHSHEVDIYKMVLKVAIETATEKCERNIFLFDEIDKMAPGVLDVLTPYMDYHHNINGVDYRKNIFIFLSNAGGGSVTKVVLDALAHGKKREEIELKHIKPLITKGALTDLGGLQNSEIVRRDLIDVYVPFLPLERKHVRQCAKAVLLSRGIYYDSEQMANEIADELIYVPEDTEIFSISGCKKVEQKTDQLYF